MAAPGWLPEVFRRTLRSGGMGKDAAIWLLYWDTAGGLSLSAPVLLPGASTPIHDHLAWGLVGLYAREQEEEAYEAASSYDDQPRAEIKLLKKNHRTCSLIAR